MAHPGSGSPGAAASEGQVTSTAIPQLLSLVELAEALRVSPHTIRKRVREGKLRPLRICRRLLFHPDEVARFLAEAK